MKKFLGFMLLLLFSVTFLNVIGNADDFFSKPEKQWGFDLIQVGYAPLSLVDPSTSNEVMKVDNVALNCITVEFFPIEGIGLQMDYASSMAVDSGYFYFGSIPLLLKVYPYNMGNFCPWIAAGGQVAELSYSSEITNNTVDQLCYSGIFSAGIDIYFNPDWSLDFAFCTSTPAPITIYDRPLNIVNTNMSVGGCCHF
jgi:hypothetical protein